MPDGTEHSAQTSGKGPIKRAIRILRFGPPEVVQLEEMPRPEPRENEVLVRVEAAGLGPWDGWIRAGKSVLPQPLPLTLGSDLSGTVVGLGTGCRSLLAGADDRRVGGRRGSASPNWPGFCRSQRPDRRMKCWTASDRGSQARMGAIAAGPHESRSASRQPTGSVTRLGRPRRRRWRLQHPSRVEPGDDEAARTAIKTVRGAPPGSPPSLARSRRPLPSRVARS
jgi:hypothetical protein